MIKKILAATDGSAHAQKAIGVACDLAAKYNAELVLLHVLLRGKIPESLKAMVELEHLAEDLPPTQGTVANAPMWMTALTTGGDDSRERRQAMAVGQNGPQALEQVVHPGIVEVAGNGPHNRQVLVRRSRQIGTIASQFNDAGTNRFIESEAQVARLALTGIAQATDPLPDTLEQADILGAVHTN